MAAQFGITMKIVDSFFDDSKIERAVERANKRNLSKVGAFIRRRGRSSIRKRKKVSRPGKPPSSHTSDRTVSIKNILFGFDAVNESVIIGPVRLHGQKGIVPSLLEFGGSTTIVSRGPRDTFGGRAIISKRAKYKARPFMGPALDSEVAAGTIPQVWSGSVRA